MKNRNLKYGGVAVALTAAFIAIVVVVNVIFTALSAKFNWYTDLTSAGIYSISDGFKSVLDSLVADTDENTTVNVVLMSEEDNDALSLIQTDILSYTNEMRAKWLAYGGVEDEWDAYVARLESMGLEEYVAIYQNAYTAAYGK